MWHMPLVMELDRLQESVAKAAVELAELQQSCSAQIISSGVEQGLGNRGTGARAAHASLVILHTVLAFHLHVGQSTLMV